MPPRSQYRPPAHADLLAGRQEVTMPQAYPAEAALTLLFESEADSLAFEHWLTDMGGWGAFGEFVDGLP